MGEQCKNQVTWSWKKSIGYTIIKLGHMVLKGVNRVQNTKIRSCVFERRYKYRSYLLRQVVFHFTEKSMDFSVWCCPLEGWVGNVVFVVSDLKYAQKLRFLALKLRFLSKTAVFMKTWFLALKTGFHQKLWFSQKPWFFSFLPEISTGKHLSMAKRKTTCLER